MNFDVRCMGLDVRRCIVPPLTTLHDASQVELAPSETSLYALLAGIAAVLSLVTVMPAFRVARCYYEATVHHAVNPATQ